MKEKTCYGCGYTFSNEYRGEPTDIGVSFDYGSKYDGESWHFALCDVCLDAIVGGFYYPPVIKGRE